MAISGDSVVEVVSSANVEYLDSLLSVAQSSLGVAMEVAEEQWVKLPYVFQAFQADGAYYMLDPSVRAAHEWGIALASARTALAEAATETLPALATRRTRLLERIVEANRQSSDADGAVALADAQYWAAYGSDPESNSTTSARESRMDALHIQEQAREVESQLEFDIERFRRDVEDEEEAIARTLAGISGGDEVLGAGGTEVRVSQTFWGFAEQAYPGAPRESLDLEDRLRDEVSQATVARINKLSVIDPAAAEEWLDAHPEFAATIGFIDPAVAARLWRGLAAESTRASDGSGAERWATGPLAQLFDLAPYTIGRLNGAPATARDEFNREILRRTLEDPDATAEQRRAAEQTQMALDRAQKASPEGTVVQLVVFEVPADGEERDMRAAISVGDLDTARYVGVMLPGMDSSVAVSMDGLVGNAINLQDAHTRIGNTEPTASVVWMGFESPGPNPATGEFLAHDDLAQEGAPHLVRFMNGIDVANPSAETTILAYSYSTRMASYALSAGQFGGAHVDHLVFYGSPGLAEPVRTVDNLIGVPPSEVYSTKSIGDQLPVSYGDPRRIPEYVDELSSTEDEGHAGLAELGERMSDLVGADNVDPNDPSFWDGHEPNIFVSDGVLGHSADKTPNSDGYWSPGADSIRDGALITAGRGDEAK